MSHPGARRILVAGFGNVLRGDDGFGVELLRRLRGDPGLPPGVAFLEAGIGGIHLVQELAAGYDAVVVLDAAEGGLPSGTTRVLRLEVADLGVLSEAERRACLADTHYAEPTRALALARALGVLPPHVFLVACQPANADDLSLDLSPPVREALAGAQARVSALLRTLAASPCNARHDGTRRGQAQGEGLARRRFGSSP